ncbi:hypothetical protein TIFTF001_009439 [Ficus carica]|uniref:Uncharacterized protein n=1 Tax=Ficus carica TaxID=3494 RepID=A0AA88D3L0_FICCA|nr:hypothetical protein TIFTF001_009439 [Ficus carica]
MEITTPEKEAINENNYKKLEIPADDTTVDEDELSPVEEVRLTVPNTDDKSVPVWTFRMWFLGLISCALLSFLNQFFSYRKEPLVVTQITVLVATLPAGRFMAAMLPKKKFRVPGLGSREFSLNPGPFNMKEHVLISIFANAGSAFDLDEETPTPALLDSGKEPPPFPPLPTTDPPTCEIATRRNRPPYNLRAPTGPPSDLSLSSTSFHPLAAKFRPAPVASYSF